MYTGKDDITLLSDQQQCCLSLKSSRSNILKTVTNWLILCSAPCIYFIFHMLRASVALALFKNWIFKVGFFFVSWMNNSDQCADNHVGWLLVCGSAAVELVFEVLYAMTEFNGVACCTCVTSLIPTECKCFAN